ncbi:MAG: hypothetical protein ACUZ77_10520 [Candidatus Brocadiales bacterium]
MNINSKPVRKCHGCKLNLGDSCAVYDSPHNKWHNSKCSGYNNPELIKKHQEEIEKLAHKIQDENRKIGAKARQNEEHHQGVRVPTSRKLK